VGLYDERIFLYGEDVEASYRLRSDGWVCRYCPSAVVYHYTYEVKSEIKPAQYAGSIAANMFLRLLYGSKKDAIAVPILIAAMLWRKPYESARADLWRHLKKSLFPHWFGLLGQRKKMKIRNIFPFRGMDYEFIREGAFYDLCPPWDGVEEPCVSIVTRTVKGREKFLVQAAQSVFNQTYRNIEWVVVEDGGHWTQEIVERLATKTDITIKYLGLEKVGRSVAGNRGLEVSTGDFIMFLDDDDLLYADHVEVLLRALHENTTCVAAYSLAWQIQSKRDDDGDIVESVPYVQIQGHKQDFDYEKLREMNYIPIQSILFSRALFEERRGFDPDIDHLEDWNLWQRYAHRNRFVYVPKTTSLYRVPADIEEQIKRQALLDLAYEDVKNKSASHIAEINKKALE
jgi:GT2 family glycosyltransferase